jgi:hypothetical protein
MNSLEGKMKRKKDGRRERLYHDKKSTATNIMWECGISGIGKAMHDVLFLILRASR